jgi:hypothetical protein
MIRHKLEPMTSEHMEALRTIELHLCKWLVVAFNSSLLIPLKPE